MKLDHKKDEVRKSEFDTYFDTILEDLNKDYSDEVAADVEEIIVGDETATSKQEEVLIDPEIKTDENDTKIVIKIGKDEKFTDVRDDVDLAPVLKEAIRDIQNTIFSNKMTLEESEETEIEIEADTVIINLGKGEVKEEKTDEEENFVHEALNLIKVLLVEEVLDSIEEVQQTEIEETDDTKGEEKVAAKEEDVNTDKKFDMDEVINPKNVFQEATTDPIKEVQQVEIEETDDTKGEEKVEDAEEVAEIVNEATTDSIEEVQQTEIEETDDTKGEEKVEDAEEVAEIINEEAKEVKDEEDSDEEDEDEKDKESDEDKKEESEEKIVGGLADGKDLEDIAKEHGVDEKELEKELEKGIEVEKEHTDDEEEAKEIAKDHLVEDPKYYEKLEQIHEAINNILDDIIENTDIEMPEQPGIEEKIDPVDADLNVDRNFDLEKLINPNKKVEVVNEATTDPIEEVQQTEIEETDDTKGEEKVAPEGLVQEEELKDLEDLEDEKVEDPTKELRRIEVENKDKEETEVVNEAVTDSIKEVQQVEIEETDDTKGEEKIEVSKVIHYKSLREAFLLDDNYFVTESVVEYTAEQKVDKLNTQISLLLAKDSKDPAFNNLLESIELVKHHMNEIKEKYGEIAKDKVNQIIDK